VLTVVYILYFSSGWFRVFIAPGGSGHPELFCYFEKEKVDLPIRDVTEAREAGRGLSGFHVENVRDEINSMKMCSKKSAQKLMQYIYSAVFTSSWSLDCNVR